MFTAEEETVARILAAWRGVDPDAAVTITTAEGETAAYSVAWHGYVEPARQIIAALAA